MPFLALPLFTAKKNYNCKNVLLNLSFAACLDNKAKNYNCKLWWIQKVTIVKMFYWICPLQLDQTMKTKMSIEELERSFLRFDDLESLTSTTNIQSVESALVSIPIFRPTFHQESYVPSKRRIGCGILFDSHVHWGSEYRPFE